MAHGAQVAARIDGQGVAVAEVDQIGGVAEAFVYDGDDVGKCHEAPITGVPGLRALTRT